MLPAEVRRLGRALAWIAAAACLASAPALAADTGTVRGAITLVEKGTFGGEQPSDDASGVVVYVTGFTRAAPAAIAELRQRKQRFEPRVLPVVRGQTVTFPNDDRIYHNVFSVSPLAEFDLGQYKGQDPPRTVTFEKPGLVPVYCNIHPQMLSYVAVLENDAFVVTGKDGRFEIGGLPSGALVLNAWAPGATRVSQPIDVTPGGVVEAALTVRKTEKVGPHKRKDGSDYPDDYDGE
jgi:plastocyanin